MVAETVQAGTSIMELARQAYQSHGPDIESHKSAVMSMLKADPELYEQYAESLIESGIARAVYAVRCQIIASVKRPPTPNSPRGIDGIRAVGKLANESLLRGWCMPDGRVLADYTGSELLPVIEEMRHRAAGINHHAAFFELLARHAGANRVGEAVSETQARELWNNSAGKGQHQRATHEHVARSAESKQSAGKGHINRETHNAFARPADSKQAGTVSRRDVENSVAVAVSTKKQAAGKGDTSSRKGHDASHPVASKTSGRNGQQVSESHKHTATQRPVKHKGQPAIQIAKPSGETSAAFA